MNISWPFVVVHAIILGLSGLYSIASNVMPQIMSSSLEIKKTILINRQKTADALARTNGIFRNSYWPEGVLRIDCSLKGTCIALCQRLPKLLFITSFSLWDTFFHYFMRHLLVLINFVLNQSLYILELWNFGGTHFKFWWSIECYVAEPHRCYFLLNC